jgi:hypothetical protein
MEDNFMSQDVIRDDKSQKAKRFMLEDDRNPQHNDLDKAKTSRDISVALNARLSPGDFLRCPRDVVSQLPFSIISVLIRISS